jgi:predicted N-formylglutamate amidohydrolase
MTKLLLTCEHAVNIIPTEYSRLLNIPANALNSHRGFDRGAYELCTYLPTMLKCECVTGEYSRLLVDLNRSKSGKNLFSEYSRKLTRAQRQNILTDYYFPYREKVERFVTENIMHKHKIVHFSIHSFTPVLDGKTRNADIGLLYDPARSTEKKIANKIKHKLENLPIDIKVRRNYPYRGVSDGMVSHLRKKLKQSDYVGFELEFNQNLFTRHKMPGRILLNEIKTHLPGILRNATMIT